MKSMTQQEKIEVRVAGYQRRGAIVEQEMHGDVEVYVVYDEDGCIQDWFPVSSDDCDPTWMQ